MKSNTPSKFSQHLGRLAILLALIMAGNDLFAAVRVAAPREPRAVPAEEEQLSQATEPAGEAEPGDKAADAGKKQVPWLGLIAEEASEALGAQLGLHLGEGLVVARVEPGSPAAQAGLEKNDVLVELEDQRLVHPAQLRKLVLGKQPGDEVRISFYRAGKEQSVTATIGKIAEPGWAVEFGDLPGQWRDSIAGPMREQMKALRESLAQAGVNGEAIREQVRRSMEQARKAIEEAMQQATNTHRHYGAAGKELKDLSHSDVEVDKNASVTVHSQGSSVKTMVKSDASGSYVIVADPRKRLTAHDKEGKLLFDGEIETQDEQSKVPPAVWDKVQPMLDEMK